MKNLWMRFGCFIIGYKYEIMKNSSEASAKLVKKNMAALLIISIIWGFIGYSFANRNIGLDVIGSSIGAFVAIFIVIQIEKQIILDIDNNKWARGVRVSLGIIMAVLGSIIIDQILFEKDIDIEREKTISDKIEERFPSRIAEYKEELSRLDSSIRDKEEEIKKLNKEPVTIRSVSYKDISITNKKEGIDSLGNKTSNEKGGTKRAWERTNIHNTKLDRIPTLQKQIEAYETKRDTLTDKKIKIRETLVEEIRNEKGFLNELELMLTLLTDSCVALAVWILFFLLFFSLELFIVFNKWNTEPTDYDVAIKHQRDVRIKAIKALTKE